MKTLISLMMAFCLVSFVNAQEDSTINNRESDTTNVTLGRKQIRIVEKDGETDIKVNNLNDNDNNENFSNKGNNREFDDFNSKSWKNEKKRKKNFKGHWDAFQIGVNSYLSADKSTSLPAEVDYMSLKINKSININFDLFQQSIGIIGNSVGILTGLGLEYCNYVFDGDNTINTNNENYIVGEFPGYQIDKSKLVTSYLTVPLLLEFQLPADRHSNRFYVNAGIVGGVKLGSHTKIKYREDGDKQNKKDRDDFNINALRYGFAGRIGVKHISLYGTYYPVSLFEKNKGPELYPFMLGFSFDGF